MKRFGVVYLLLGSFSWCQAASLGSAAVQEPVAPTTATGDTTTRNLAYESVNSTAALDKPLITVTGLCDNPSAEAAASNCKTVITQAQFEKLVNAVQPSMSARARREFALNYAEALVMAKKAEQMGLDKGVSFEEQMRLSRIQVLSQDLKKVIQEKASQISDKDVEDYYNTNTAKFEKAEMDRIYIPKSQQALSVSDKKLTDGDTQMHSQDSEQTMKEEADNLRARAVAGEEFTKLQADAYQVARIKSTAPNTSMVIRRISLPPNQVSAMDLSPGKVSSVLADPNGYVIYKVKTKSMLSMDQARDEIKATLRLQRTQEEMQSIEESVTPTLDESYFVRRRASRGTTGATEQAKPGFTPHASDPN